ncbi:urease accessory protein UreD [Streptomyces tubbatahanensis]|uniref:Urease accessory protein UreD n=1 Tax=Streptomyces tubbatahanensis TaxID=2923272 RepID=A0ABY3Y1M1_9ACTN|nr:urease accessory protein UreD [Streptomyces tubbatahanensis]UNT00484.1 urease accessory protein UreD [Streptomyces tubbatahanensis]
MSTAVAAGARMRACARVATESAPGPEGRPRTWVSGLRSQAPLKLFSTRAKEGEPSAAHRGVPARVSVAAGAAGPIGGDELRLEVEVGAGSVLVLSEVSPSLLLPGREGRLSTTRVRISVAAGGTLVWLPEPLVAARGCDHLNEVRIDLADDAALLMREEVVLGRHGETGGRVRLSTRVRRSGRALLCQDLELGAGAGRTPVVADGHRAVGSVLVADPLWCAQEARRRPRAQLLSGDAVVTPLPQGAALISALGQDNAALRDTLRSGLAAIGAPWSPRPVPPPP